MTTKDNHSALLRRRDVCVGTLAFGASAFLSHPSGAAEGALRAWWDEATGDLKDVADDAREAVAYFLGMESYVFGYPLVMMDVTRDVLTAAPAPNADGTAAPMNQLAKMPHYVSPDFKNVVRISLNSLWTTGWMDLAAQVQRRRLPRYLFAGDLTWQGQGVELAADPARSIQSHAPQLLPAGGCFRRKLQGSPGKEGA